MPLPAALGTALDQAGLNATARARTEKIGRYTVDAQVTGALRNAAKATGMGFEVLAAKAAMESGFRAEAQASTSSARGLFQFIEQTWLGVVQAHGAEHGRPTRPPPSPAPAGATWSPIRRCAAASWRCAMTPTSPPAWGRSI
ncbi:hypothetical protein [Teichococcus aestuarii]|uniref:hypothetical protein n=1 Tax=Teichococcus aestuarii TaxID=568898 RepID=UPI00360649E2